MTQQAVFVGIDVSKAQLDVHVHPSGERFVVARDRSGLRDLARRLKRLAPGGVGLEASGGYEKTAAQALSAAGLSVYVLDPAQVRAYARALRQRAKTDPIDAAMIARCLAAAQERLTPYRHEPSRDRLAALVAYRRKLVEERTANAGYADTIDEPVVRRMLTARRRALALSIACLDREIRRQIAQTPRLAERHDLIAGIPGVGPVLAATLIADLPELGAIGAKRIASLVGVAPHARQSGSTDRRGRCAGGRKQVRDVLFMATLSAIKAKAAHLRPFYDRLRAAGKEFKPAIVATMRKFITILNAIVRDQTTFQIRAP